MLLMSCCWLTAYPFGQVSPGSKRSDTTPDAGRNGRGTAVSQHANLHLTRVGVLDVPSVMTHGFSPPFKCDGDGNIYFRGLEPTIQKLSAKGERVALFEAAPNSEKRLLHAGAFDVTPDGEVYELAFPQEFKRYVFVFKSDGSFKAPITLNTGFWWFPSSLAVFQSGEMLITGSEYDKDVNSAMWPFTGIFGADGNLLKEVKLEDDETLHDMAASGDKRVSSVENPQINHAVDFTQVERASDGNVYVMRWTNPAIIYAISPGGAVVRRLKIDPGDKRFYPHSLHTFQNRLAILFLEPTTFNKIIKVVDLEGHEIAIYDDIGVNGPDGKKQPMLSGAFYCYTENPTRFVFLGAEDDGKLQFVTVEPR